VGNKLYVDEIVTISALQFTNTLSWICIVLAYWNNSLWVDKLLHPDTLSWFRTNQWSRLIYVSTLLFNLWSLVLFYRGSNPQFYSTRGEDIICYIIDAVRSISRYYIVCVLDHGKLVILMFKMVLRL